MARIHFNHADAHRRVRKDDSKQNYEIKLQENLRNTRYDDIRFHCFTVSLQATTLSDQANGGYIA
jgi:hypothetical protein